MVMDITLVRPKPENPQSIAQFCVFPLAVWPAVEIYVDVLGRTEVLDG